MFLIVTFIIQENSVPHELFQVKRGVIGYLFIYAGYICARYNVVRKIGYGLALFLIVTFSYVGQLNGFSSMSYMNHAWLYLLTATVMSVSIIALCRALEEKRVLNKDSVICFYGRNSLIILCTNNFLIEVIRLVDFKLTGNILLNIGFAGSIIFFFILMLLECPIMKKLEGKFA